MRRKWQSRRWIIALWALLMASALIVSAVIRDRMPQGLESALPLLLGIIGGYIAADSLTKPKGGTGE